MDMHMHSLNIVIKIIKLFIHNLLNKNINIKCDIEMRKHLFVLPDV